MTYSGELVMPAGYVEVAEEEMMYLDGGWSAGKLWKNLKGLTSSYATIKAIAKATGVWAYISKGVIIAANQAAHILGAFIVKTGVKLSTISRALAATFVVGAAAACWALGTYRLFY